MGRAKRKFLFALYFTESRGKLQGIAEVNYRQRHLFFLDIRTDPLIQTEGKFDYDKGCKENDESHSHTSFV